jgi:hypothetical protein
MRLRAGVYGFSLSLVLVFTTAANKPTVPNVAFVSDMIQASHVAANDIYLLHRGSIAASKHDLNTADVSYADLAAEANGFLIGLAFSITTDQWDLPVAQTKAAAILKRAQLFDSSVRDTARRQAANIHIAAASSQGGKSSATPISANTQASALSALNQLNPVSAFFTSGVGLLTSVQDLKTKTQHLQDEQRKAVADSIETDALWPPLDTASKVGSPNPTPARMSSSKASPEPTKIKVPQHQ